MAMYHVGWRAVAMMAVIVLGGCRQAPAPVTRGEPVGEWRYVAYEPGRQRLAAQGYLTLGRPEPMRVQAGRQDHEVSRSFDGNWRIDAMGRSDIGPQDGRGDLVGTIRGNRVTMNLHPAHADNNIFLDGRFVSADRIEGQWEHVGLAGVMTAGRFEARRLR